MIKKPRLYTVFLFSLWAFLFAVTTNVTGTIEGRLFPVVEDFKVSNVKIGDGKIWIHGTFYKARVCDFRGLAGLLTDDEHDLRSEVLIEFQDGDKIRVNGHETYGPWQLNITGEQLATLEFESEHECHGFWKTVTTFEPILINLPPENFEPYSDPFFPLDM